MCVKKYMSFDAEDPHTAGPAGHACPVLDSLRAEVEIF